MIYNDISMMVVVHSNRMADFEVVWRLEVPHPPFDLHLRGAPSIQTPGAGLVPNRAQA